MRAWSKGRPLKRWVYAGAYGPDCMVCAGIVHVAGFRQAFWAVWDGDLAERTVVLRRGGIAVSPDRVIVPGRMELTVAPAGEPVEVTSAHGRAEIWTRKTPVTMRGSVGDRSVELPGLVDESAGYHARRTDWEWSAGVGFDGAGRRVTWNLVRGVHDGPGRTERAVWVDGVPRELGPSAFSVGLDSVAFPGGGLTFTAVAERRRRDNLILIQSDYVQPFGRFAGGFGEGVELEEGFGVMERHRAKW